MNSDKILSFVMANIYCVSIINLSIIGAIFISMLRNRIHDNRYRKVYERMKPAVEEYIKYRVGAAQLRTSADELKNTVALDIMLEYMKVGEENVNLCFEELGYIGLLKQKAEKGITLNLVKNLGLMKSQETYDILIRGINSEDFEIRYMSFYALSLLELKEVQLDAFVARLIASEIIRDRQIEILSNFHLTTSKCLELLEKQETELGKVILLRVLQDKAELSEDKYSECLIKYIGQDKEIRLSAVLTLASSRNVKYLPILIDLYKNEKEWEIRAAIVKSLIAFPADEILEPLRLMVHDVQWWVRFNAVEVLARLGAQGIEVLIDLSLDYSDGDTSNLAYYMLNSNKNIYETVQRY